MKKASEKLQSFLISQGDREEATKQKEMFVENLGELLSQTREDIISCELVDPEHVVIHYKDGETQRVNVAGDSYTAIVKDVVNAILL